MLRYCAPLVRAADALAVARRVADAFGAVDAAALAALDASAASPLPPPAVLAAARAVLECAGGAARRDAWAACAAAAGVQPGALPAYLSDYTVRASLQTLVVYATVSDGSDPPPGSEYEALRNVTYEFIDLDATIVRGASWAHVCLRRAAAVQCAARSLRDMYIAVSAVERGAPPRCARSPRAAPSACTTTTCAPSWRAARRPRCAMSASAATRCGRSRGRSAR